MFYLPVLINFAIFYTQQNIKIIILISAFYSATLHSRLLLLMCFFSKLPKMVACINFFIFPTEKLVA